ncbi:hypothetical protein HIM_08260 [Hirsutella minnesotensis 3608]|uniref:LCCL domain-containing protein n=1 Tax=Hirsutella minnesotensis 3608 TaxID=1043627 RepID=A0A0F8A3S4_9HYPO|nr:hypothetical protein HIM_08260 [Hirsutella minnesotensis 3608]
MAAPANKTIKDLSGKWVLNKNLSDNPDKGLSLQGIGYLTRKAMGLASVTIVIKQYEGAPTPPSTAGGTVTRIDIEQSAGPSTTKDDRCLDDLPRSYSHWLFGDVEGRSRWAKVADIDDAYLKKGWEGDELVLSHLSNKGSGWEAYQVQGFQVISGERRYCRNVVITKGSERAEFRFVYDFSG